MNASGRDICCCIMANIQAYKWNKERLIESKGKVLKNWWALNFKEEDNRMSSSTLLLRLSQIRLDSEAVTDLCQLFTGIVEEIYQTVPITWCKIHSATNILYLLCVYLIYLHVNVLHLKYYYRYFNIKFITVCVINCSKNTEQNKKTGIKKEEKKKRAVFCGLWKGVVMFSQAVTENIHGGGPWVSKSGMLG